MVANGAYTEFNLLKARKASVSEITKKIKFLSILILTPSPLDYKRQEYLYHNLSEMNLKTLLVPSQYKM